MFTIEESSESPLLAVRTGCPAPTQWPQFGKQPVVTVQRTGAIDPFPTIVFPES
jgi:hypothetical protein